MNNLVSIGIFLGCTMLFAYVEAENKPTSEGSFVTIVDPLTAGRRTGTIRHELNVTYDSLDTLAQKMEEVLNRWKPILAHPNFNRTAVSINTVNTTQLDHKDVHRVKYDVMITEAANGLPKLNQKLAIAYLEKSLKQHPIEGVRVFSAKRTIFDMTEITLGGGLPV